MKRIFTLLCALILLLTSFSGMVASAAEMDAAAQQEFVMADSPEDVVMVAPTMFAKPAIPTTYASAGAQNVGEDLLDYLKAEFAQCNKNISIAQFALPYNEVMATALMYAIWYEMPELFHCYELGVQSTNGTITNLHVSYRPYADTPQEYQACLREMEQGAEYLLRGVKGNDALTDVEKALILHDRLAIWTEYDMEYAYDREGAIFSAYGALGKQSAVCQGYTLAYIYLLEQVGIQSDFCSSQKLNHAWNIVYINDKPYYTDVTWDDPVNYFGEYTDDLGRVMHENFLRSLYGIKTTGHNTDDFPQVEAGTEYDSGQFWSDHLNTSVELIGNDLYYMTDKIGGNVVWRVTDSDPVSVFTTERNFASKLSSTSDMLLVSRERDVVMVNPKNGQYDVVYVPDRAQKEGSYIEGMKFQKNKLWVQISCNYNAYSTRDAIDFADSAERVVITQQPKNVMVPSGSTAKVSVKAEGYGLCYRWAEEVPGVEGFTETDNATDTYAIKMTAALDGTRVYCLITDMYGNIVVSDTVTLRMGNPAKITTQPGNAAAPNGSTVKVTLKASGDGISYAWYYRKKNAQDYKLSGNMKSNYLSVKMSKDWDGCEVYCVVTDKYGNSVTSKVVKLHAGTPVKITTQPKNSVAPKDSTAKVTIKASGSSLKYAWYYMKKGESKYTKTSATKNEFSVKMSSSWKDAKVYCVVTDKFGVSVKSSVVTLKMGNVAKITTQPVNVAVSSGKTAKVSVKATGDGLTYQWYYAKKGSSKFTKTSVKTATYSVKMSSSVNGRQVYCVVKDKYGNEVKSSVATLYKGTPVKIKTQPKNTSAFSGKTAKFTVKASGSSLKYTWYYMKKGADKYTKASSTKKDYSVKMSASWDGAKVYCVVKDKYGISVKSSVVTLALAQKAAIKTQPKNVKVYNGDTAKVSVKATGDGLTYQWYYAKKGSSSFKKISGATKASYSVKMSSSVNGRKVYCEVKDQYGNKVKSKTVTLTMFDPVALVAGSYKSTHLYIPGGYWLQDPGLSMTISTAGKVTMKAKTDGGTETASYKLQYLGQEDGEYAYKVYNSEETVILYYDKSAKEAYIEVDGGYVFVMKRK